MSDTQLHVLFPFSVGSSVEQQQNKGPRDWQKINISDIPVMWFHIQVVFRMFYRYMGKEYHYVVIILKYRVNSVSLLCSTSKINEILASSSLRTAGYMTVHLLGVLS